MRKDEKDESVRRRRFATWDYCSEDPASVAGAVCQETDLDTQRVLNSLFIQGNATALVAIARGKRNRS